MDSDLKGQAVRFQDSCTVLVVFETQKPTELCHHFPLMDMLSLRGSRPWKQVDRPRVLSGEANSPVVIR
jgi:hypothetical protein